MQRNPCKVQLSDDDRKQLTEYALAHGLVTDNALLAVAAAELVKAKKKGLNLWHVIGRIAAEEPTTPGGSGTPKLPSQRPALEIAR